MRDQAPLAIDERCGIATRMIITLIFGLGIANFALHSAVLDSGHPLLGGETGRVKASRGAPTIRITMVLEFAILVAAMLLADRGWTGIGWGYLFYTGINALSAWLILTRRI